jgi:hypothetical protein
MATKHSLCEKDLSPFLEMILAQKAISSGKF